MLCLENLNDLNGLRTQDKVFFLQKQTKVDVVKQAVHAAKITDSNWTTIKHAIEEQQQKPLRF